MSELVILIGTKEVSLHRALKYQSDPEKCQSKLGLTPKEYKKIVKLLKQYQANPQQMVHQEKPFQPPPPPQQFQAQPPQQFKAQPPQQFKAQPPQIKYPVQTHMSTFKPPSNVESWYGSSSTEPADKSVVSNSALLDRRFFNATSQMDTPRSFTSSHAHEPAHEPSYLTPKFFDGQAPGPASRVFDLKQDSIPISPFTFPVGRNFSKSN